MNQKLICFPHVLCQTLLFACWCWWSFIIEKDVSATEIYDTWITFIIWQDFTGLCHHIAGILIESPFEGNRFHLRIYRIQMAAKNAPQDSSWWFDWTTHLNQKYAHVNRFHFKIASFGYQKFRDLTGFVIPIRNAINQDVLCFFFLSGSSSFCVPYTSHSLYIWDITILHHLPKKHPSWRDRSLPTNLWQPDQ